MAKKNAKTELKLIDEPLFNYWQAMYMSFYSKQLYVDVGKRWRGTGLLYLFLLILLLSVPVGLKSIQNFDNMFKNDILNPLAQIPTLVVRQGILYCAKPMPYLIKDNQGDVVLIIDTTGKVNQFTAEYPKLRILINKNQMAIKVPNPGVAGITPANLNEKPAMTQVFDKDINLIFNGKQLTEDKVILNLKFIGEILVYPTVAATLYGIFAVMLLVLGFLGQLFTSIFFSFSISLMQGFRLLIVAATPMLMLLLLFIIAMNWLFFGSGIVLMGLLIGYFSFAVRALKAESKKLVIS